MSFYQAAGCIALAPVDEFGKPTGAEFEVGESGELSIGITHEDPTTIQGRTCRTFGKIVGSKPGAVNAAGTMVLRNYSARNLALALDGKITTNNTNTQTLTDKEIQLGAIGDFVDIGAAMLTDVIVKNQAGDDTLEPGTDYTLNGPWGRIAAANETTANTTVKISGTAADDKSIRVSIGAVTPGYYSVRVTALNTINSKTKKIYLRKVRIATSENVNFVSDDGTEYETLSFNLTPEIPTNGTDYGYADGFSMN